MTIATPRELQQFRQRRIGNHSRTVVVESSADPNVIHQARYFADHIANDVIQFKDRSNNFMVLHPKNYSVHAVLTSGSHLARFLPENYRIYNVTFNASETNNNDNLRDIFNLRNATYLTLATGLEVRTGFERTVDGLRNLRQLRELTVNINPKFSTVQLTPFLQLPPSVTRVRVTLPARKRSWTQRAYDESTQELANNQCLPPAWELSSDSNGSITFNKTNRNIRRVCWDHISGYRQW